MRTIRRVAFLMVATCALFARADDEPRTALVVGVKDYHDLYFPGLDAPIEDMKAMQSKLQALGFQVETLANPTRRQLLDGVDAFGDRLAQRGGVGLFYYSGHGAMKTDEDANYLIPAGTNIRTENDLPEEAVNAQRIANRMKEAKNPLNLVLLDACRSHGLPRGNGSKAAGGGLAAMRGARGLIFFFATQPGAVAIEDSGVKSSLFTRALLKKMDAPGLSFMDMVSDVTVDTESLSLEGAGKEAVAQSPFVSGTVSGRFYFRPNKEPAPLVQRGTRDVLHGMTLGDVDADAREKFGINEGINGMVILEIDQESLSAKAGLKTGDVIYDVGRERVATAKQGLELIGEKMKNDDKKRVLLRVSTGDHSRYVILASDPASYSE